MVSDFDDKIVISALKLEVASTSRELSASRDYVNKVYYECSTSAGFQHSANVLLRLYDQAGELLDSINSRL
jgi:hypothetical protein